VRLDGPQGRRLRTYGPGTIVGEVAFYLKVPRSAWVVADGTVRLDRLAGPALERMAAEQPSMLATVHEALAALVCERLAHSNRLIRMLT
jgi:SulP family sulfate permease